MGLENGYQTVCGASGGHLSGGERQRISIARAMPVSYTHLDVYKRQPLHPGRR